MIGILAVTAPTPGRRDRDMLCVVVLLWVMRVCLLVLAVGRCNCCGGVLVYLVVHFLVYGCAEDVLWAGSIIFFHGSSGRGPEQRTRATNDCRQLSRITGDESIGEKIRALASRTKRRKEKADL